ncbi:hypothetical protein C8A03DRAFT_12453 [Achaetomium macrosporum]|uniref:Elongator complex protein 5 n=1 Tax=Achaetomium macrosporum TaxID=79813 RepID=A0AAN7HDR7_9PEZI|nr:hypothetical protein C8A03DRAFT_12453 [Achaetomium macrosporum]
MAPSAQAHKRAHSLLLVEKLLNLRDSASPLNLILDTLEQSAQPLMQEFMRRAKNERAKIVFVSFAAIKKPASSDVFIRARGKSLKALAAEIVSHVAPPRTRSKDTSTTTVQRSLILIDTLNPLASHSPHLLPSFFTSIIPHPSVSLVAVYHTDVPTVPLHHHHQQSPISSISISEYSPDPLTLLTHIATAIFRVSSLYQAIESHRARERSLAEPEWGLREGREGVLIGLRRNGNGNGSRVGDGMKNDDDGVVVEMEMRRRSGRAVAERFVLVRHQRGSGLKDREEGGWGIMLMADHPAFRKPVLGGDDGGEGEEGEEQLQATFNLGLTEKQRRDREGVVLPYFDAQVEVGGGEGGRILYEMGREDDFDEEDDEI